MTDKNDSLRQEKQSTLQTDSTFGSQRTFQRLGRIFWRLVLFATVVLVIVAVGLGFWFKNIFAPIQSVENATQTQLSQWFVFRDLNDESSTVGDQLTNKYVGFIESQIDSDAEIPYVKMVQGQIRDYLSKRPDSETSQETNEFQRLYIVLPRKVDETNQSVFVLPSDIVPGPDLILQPSVSGERSDAAKWIKVEQNCRFVVRNWLLQKLEEYERTPDDQKAAFIQKTSSQFEHFQLFYNKLLKQIGLEEAGDLALLKEFDRLVVSWRLDYSDKNLSELARLLWFKDLLVSSIVMERANLPQTWILPKAKVEREKTPSALTTFLLKRSGKKNPPSSTPAEPANEIEPPVSNDSEETVEFF